MLNLKFERKFFLMKKVKILELVSFILNAIFTLGAVTFLIIYFCFSDNPVFRDLCSVCVILALSRAIIFENIIKKLKKKEMLKIRNTSAKICDLFDELLDKHDITIPSDDRIGEESEARIYGKPYYDLEDSVTELIASVCEDIKENPYITLNTEEY